MSITEAIESLKNYNGPYKLTLHTGASEELIKAVEDAYGFAFPADFKTFYRFTDGFEIDEDIFNMVPLAEMRENKDGVEKSWWIAEYMIYSDMWGLEVNPDDTNKYQIFVIDANSGKTLLTNSLGEFITRVLNNGVFNDYGLYHWQDENKAKINGNTDPYAMKPLLSVFCRCLELGIITTDDVIARANWIISTEVDPHPFFVEMANSNSLFDLLSVLNSIHLRKHHTSARDFRGSTYPAVY